MTHDELKSLLALAALERLEANEDVSLRAHLSKGCAECEAELRELREAAAALAMADETATSETQVASKIEARLALSAAPVRGRDAGRSVGSERRRSTMARRVAWMASAAAVILAVYGAAVTLRLLGTEGAYEHRLGDFEQRISTVQAQARKASEKADELSELLSERVQLEHVLESPDLEITRLGPSNVARGARAIVAVSRELRVAVIEADGLPATTQDRTYEMWWVTRESGPVPAGLFRAEPGHEVVARVDPPPTGQHVTAGAVTLEQAGGVKKLVGAMYLEGSPGRR
jgi:anti-sigma-K factor RskA